MNKTYQIIIISGILLQGVPTISASICGGGGAAGVKDSAQADEFMGAYSTDYTSRSGMPIEYIVLHITGEGDLCSNAASITSPSSEQKGWHYIVDESNVIQQVNESYAAHHVRFKNDSNNYILDASGHVVKLVSIGIEHVSQEYDDWWNTKPMMLARSVKLVKEIRSRHPNIAAAFVSTSTHSPGLTGHYQWDPGHRENDPAPQNLQTEFWSKYISWLNDSTKPILTLKNSQGVVNGYINASGVTVVAEDSLPGLDSIKILPIGSTQPVCSQTDLAGVTPSTVTCQITQSGQYKAISTDLVGNESSANFTVDASAPNNNGSSFPPGATFDQPDPNLCFNYSEPVSTTSVIIDGSDHSSEAHTSNNTVCVNPYLQVGTHTISVSVMDAASNSTTTASNFRIVSASSSLQIVGLQAKDVMRTSAKIYWETYKGTATINSSGAVAYGLNPLDLNSLVLDSTNAVSHTVSLPNLTEDTVYYYKAVSSANGETVMSDTQTFRTRAPGQGTFNWSLSAKATEQYQQTVLGMEEREESLSGAAASYNNGYAYTDDVKEIEIDPNHPYLWATTGTAAGCVPNAPSGERKVWFIRENMTTWEASGWPDPIFYPGSTDNCASTTFYPGVVFGGYGMTRLTLRAQAQGSSIAFHYWAVTRTSQTVTGVFGPQNKPGGGTIQKGQANTGTAKLKFITPHNGTVIGVSEIDFHVVQPSTVTLVILSTSVSGNTLFVNYLATTSYKTAPAPLSNMMVNGQSYAGNPNQPAVTKNSNINVGITPPSNPAGIYGTYYAVGSPPTSNFDGQFTADTSFAVSLPQVSGLYSIYLWQEDNVGNVDYLSRSTITVQLDLTPPVISSVTADNAVFTPNFDNYRDSTTVSFVVADAVSTQSTMTVQVLTSTGSLIKTIWNALPKATGTWSFVWDGLNVSSQPVPVGVYRILLTALDSAGNTGQIETEVSVQSSSPTILFPEMGITYGDPRISILGVAEPGTQVRIYEGGQLIGSGLTNSLGNFAIQPSNEFAFSTHSLTAQAVGPQTYTTISATTFYVDLSILPPAPGSNKITVTFNASPTEDTVQASSGAVLGGATIQFYTDVGLTDLVRSTVAAVDGSFGPILMGDDVFDNIYVVQISSDNVSPSTKLVLDQIPPASVANLTVTASTEPWTANLTWTAPGDNGTSGTADHYVLRTATYSLDSGNFDQGTLIPSVSSPSAAGSQDQKTLSGLDGNYAHYFALKTVDDAGNSSGLSNVVSIPSTLPQFTHRLTFIISFTPDYSAALPNTLGFAVSFSPSYSTGIYQSGGLLLTFSPTYGPLQSESNFSLMFTPDYGGLGAPLAPPLLDPTFRLGQVYAFPNPARHGLASTVHVEMGIADRLILRLYDMSGALIKEVDVTDKLTTVDDGSGLKYAYEYPLNMGEMVSGVYLCVAHGRKGGYSDINKMIKLAVIK